jgi:hypothetical protein
MSEQHLPKTLLTKGLGISVASSLIPTAARSQGKPAKTEANPPKTVGGIELPDPNAINKKLQKDYPPELLEDGTPTPAPTAKPTNPVVVSDGNTTALGNSNFTFVLPTPAVIAIAVVVGGLALFPVVHLLLKSKKFAEIQGSGIWEKLTAKFQKPRVLESDKFLHQRNFEKLKLITNQAENLNADKFGNTEFMAFFRIKSYIARSIDEYKNLDQIIELLTVAIGAQTSFSLIDSTESRYCSSGQQQLYKFVDGLLAQDIESSEFKNQVNSKLQEVLPLLKTEEGKVALQAYAIEINKISNNALGLKLLLMFKKYQLEDYSILRGIANTINKLESEDLLNLDSLLVLVMVQYDIFEKVGPIIGIEDRYNRPETYSKILQYIGLKARHEVSYQKFHEFLVLLKQWEVHYKSVVNVRQKCTVTEYRLPKEFTTDVPGLALYKKYQDSFHLLNQVEPSSETLSTAQEPATLTGVN